MTDREDTREIAARRAFEVWLPSTGLEDWTWDHCPAEERDWWRRVADSVLSTLQWETESALVGRIDDLERRVKEVLALLAETEKGGRRD